MENYSSELKQVLVGIKRYVNEAFRSSVQGHGCSQKRN